VKSEQERLPIKWTLAELADVCGIISGYGFPESLQGKTKGEVPFYKVGDISEAWKRHATHLTRANHYLTLQEAESISPKLLPASTTVFAKIGAAIALNRRAMLSVPALVDNNVMGLHPNQTILDPAYLYYFTCTLRLNEISQATTVPSIRKSDVNHIQIPLAPVKEQERVVAEIDKQFTRLDAAVAALRRAQANLKRYRAAVLKAACEGRLVPTEARIPNQVKPSSLVPVRDLVSEPLANGRSPASATTGTKILRLTAMRNHFIDFSECRFGNLDAKNLKNLKIRPSRLLKKSGTE